VPFCNISFILVPVERFLDSLHLLQKISLGPPELLQEYMAVNKLIRDVVPDDFYTDVSFRE
jgi:hypothetical protein